MYIKTKYPLHWWGYFDHVGTVWHKWAKNCCYYYVFFFLYFFSLRDDTEAAAFDSQSSSVIKLNNGTILYLREVNKFLALVCILREDNFDRQGKF